jgi:hypothetical protein
MRAALDGHPMNAGFLRPEAMLGVVFLGDEDDCSVTSTAMFMNSPALGPLESFRCTQFGVTCEGGGRTPDEMKQVGEKSGGGANEGSDLVDGVVAYRDFLHGSSGVRGGSSWVPSWGRARRWRSSCGRRRAGACRFRG